MNNVELISARNMRTDPEMHTNKLPASELVLHRQFIKHFKKQCQNSPTTQNWEFYAMIHRRQKRCASRNNTLVVLFRY